MPQSYFDEIAEGKSITFLKFVFCKWKGSVFKLLWKDLLMFFGLFYTMQVIYRFGMNDACQEIFEAIVTYARLYQDNTPIAFLLGFFVENVFRLWEEQFKDIPWPTQLAIQVSGSIRGFDEVGRAMRRTVMRYAILTRTIIFRHLSPKVYRRFPDMEDLVIAGLASYDEIKVIEDLHEKFPGELMYWLPTVWAATLATKARDEGRIKDDFALKSIIDTLNKFQDDCGALYCYTVVYIPLVQLQVIVLAVYTYFLTALFAHQFIEDKNEIIWAFTHIPFLLVLRFIFYMGWLKVAETMMNPFGDDDDDFDVSSMIDNHLQMSYLIVDEQHAYHPEILKDRYWDGIPSKLPNNSLDKSSVKRSHFEDVFNIDEDGNKKSVSAEDKVKNDSKPASTPSLKPRPDVIDETYHRISNIESSQTSLVREMTRIRRRSRRPDGAISDDSDDDY